MIKLKLSELSLKGQQQFALFSMARVKNLYNLFVEEIQQDQLVELSAYENGLKLLTDMHDALRKSFPDFNNDEIVKSVETSYSLAIQDHVYSSFQSTIATQIALLHVSALEFLKTKNADVMEDVLIYIEEIINIVESEMFFRANPDGSYDESESIILERIKSDRLKQLEVLKQIDEAVDLDLDSLVKGNELLFIDPDQA
ncbi:MAG: hypothetical protein AB8B56_13265 [Crocinitomicaceae bacterium]